MNAWIAVLYASLPFFAAPLYLSRDCTYMAACTLPSTADSKELVLSGLDAGKGPSWVAAGRRGC